MFVEWIKKQAKEGGRKHEKKKEVLSTSIVSFLFLVCVQVQSWKQKLPLQTIMRMLQVLVPQVEKICIDK